MPSCFSFFIAWIVSLSAIPDEFIFFGQLQIERFVYRWNFRSGRRASSLQRRSTRFRCFAIRLPPEPNRLRRLPAMRDK
jgi:hypothetical protein